MSHIAVIGGGVAGVSTAYVLARRGYRVTVIERHRYAAMETSFANGGQLSASNAEVWNQPSTIVKALKWMLRRDAPLLVSIRPSWHKLTWFAEFIGNIANYERNTIKTTQLAIAAREHLFEWAAREGINFDLEARGILHVYYDRPSFEHAATVTKVLARGGLTRREVSPTEVKAIEPALTGTFYGGFYTESDATGDIHKFTNGLADAAARLGVAFLYGRTVTRLETAGTSAAVTIADQTESSTHRFDAVVVCAGTASRALAAQVGDRVNIYPVKGYSITVNLHDQISQAAAPWVSLLDDASKIVTSRLGVDRFRVAGTAEFSGFNRNIRADRIAPLVDWVQKTFPNVSTRSVVPWAGLRPMMPDMMPRVGQGRSRCMFYNTGHGHLGWTLSAITADIIADSVSASFPIARPILGTPGR